jgi:hypothetical protein
MSTRLAGLSAVDEMAPIGGNGWRGPCWTGKNGLADLDETPTTLRGGRYIRPSVPRLSHRRSLPNGSLSHFEPLSCLSRGEVLPDHAPDADNASSDAGFSLNTSLGGGSEELNVPGLCIVRSYLASPSRHSATQPHILYIEPRDCHYEEIKERLILSL